MREAPRRARLAGIATYVPEGRLTNEELVEQYGEWSAEKIADKTGIETRSLAEPDEFTSRIAVRAGEALLERFPASREQIDQLVLMTVSPDYILPFTAGMVQTGLGLPTTVGAFDVTLACSGYVYGLGLAASMIESGRARQVLLLTADRFTPYTERGDLGVRTIFGDAGTASLIVGSEEGEDDVPAGVIGAVETGTDGSGALNLLINTSGMRGFTGDETTEHDRPTLRMNGPEVFDFTLRTVATHVKDFLARQELSIGDVDLFVFHQANLFMLQHLRRRLRIPEERFAIRMADCGNTLSSTIPLTFAPALEDGRVAPGAKVMLVGFGVGYSWGSALLQY